MSAEATAVRVLRWAGRAPVPGAGTGPGPGSREPVPQGPLHPVRPLTEPGAETRALLAESFAATAARLGAGSPPLGDPGPIGPGALLLAAAIGGAGRESEARTVAAVAEPVRLTVGRRASGWAEALSRHGVAGPVLDFLAAGGPGTEALRTLAETVLDSSPLTAILHRPPARRLADRAYDIEVRDALGLLSRPRGREVLCAALADWSPDPDVLEWRRTLLHRIADEDPDVVVQTYATAQLRHGERWADRLRRADLELRQVGREPAAWAVETVRYWSPLARLMRPGTERLVRAHPLLDLEGRGCGLAAFGRLRLVEGEA